jgi:hypothetical protein
MTRHFITLIFCGFIGCEFTSTNASRSSLKTSLITPTRHELRNSFSCKPMVNKDWVVFDNSATKEFSESFKKKLTEEMLIKLCEILENNVSDTEFEFQLKIGSPRYELDAANKTISNPFQLTTNNNFVFATADLTSIFAKLHYVTIAWSSPDFANPLDIHKSDISNKKVEFFWCKDFPKEDIISDLSPTKITTKDKSGYKFDVVYYLKVFPDVSIIFDFDKKPSKESLNEIEKEVERYGDKFKTVFVHELREFKGYYLISINHNTIDFDNYSDKDFQKDVQNFDFLLKNLNDNNKITDLRQIKFQ